MPKAPKAIITLAPIPEKNLPGTLETLESLGLRWDSVSHKSKKRRQMYGKVPPYIAQAVYDAYLNFQTLKRIAERFRIGETTICRIVRNPKKYGLEGKALKRHGRNR